VFESARAITEPLLRRLYIKNEAFMVSNKLPMLEKDEEGLRRMGKAEWDIRRAPHLLAYVIDSGLFTSFCDVYSHPWPHRLILPDSLQQARAIYGSPQVSVKHPCLPMAFNFNGEVYNKFAPVHQERIPGALAQLISCHHYAVG
jgi:hypothetical protein